MRTLYQTRKALLLCGIFASTVALAQFEIPNGNFESWDFNGWNYSPTAWVTHNTQLTQDAYQDTASAEGQFAVQLRPIYNGIGAEGSASIELPLTYIPASLDFMVKYERDWSAYVAVEIRFYNEEVIVYSEYWSAEDTVSDWMAVHMELDQIEPIITHTTIKAGVFVGDLVPGDGWISVDAMGFEGANSLLENELVEVSLYPNPTSEALRISVEDPSLVDLMEIYNSAGKLVHRSAFQSELSVQDLSTGNYVLLLTGSAAVLGRRGFVVE